MSKVAKVSFDNYPHSVAAALDLIDVAASLPRDRLIIVKPNLTNSDPPPVTTPVEIVEAILLYCKAYTDAPIAIGEGSGSGTTADAFRKNGYTALAEKHGIPLIDFNTKDAIPVCNPKAYTLKEFHIPRIVPDAFIISAPVLKDHSFTQTTVAMKNMFGIAPAPFYAGSWNKSKLHSPSTHKSVVDICLYKKPDLCVVDAVVALAGMHLAGTPTHLNTVLASFDCVAVDAVASRMLNHKPDNIEYLRLANHRLGDMDNIKLLTA